MHVETAAPEWIKSKIYCPVPLKLSGPYCGERVFVVLSPLLVVFCYQQSHTHTLMQTDLETLNRREIRAIARDLSEEQAQNLIHKEKNGSARKEVLEMLAVQARKARRKRVMKQALVEGLHLRTVSKLAVFITATLHCPCRDS